MNSKSRSLVLVVVFLFIASFLTFAQADKPAPNAPVTTLRTSSRLVVVDVIAIDSKGQPVADLQRDDFVLNEDGKPQAIKQFESRMLAAKPAAGAVPVAAKSSETQFTNVPQVPGTAVNIVLLDAINSVAGNEQQARQHLVQFLRTLPRGERVGLYLLDTHLRLVQPFTDSTDKLIAAINGLGLRSSPFYTGDDKRKVYEELDNLAADTKGSDAGTEIIVKMRQFLSEDLSRKTDMRVNVTLDAMRQLARSVSGIPGRKNLIWLSEGFPISLDADYWLKRPMDVQRTYYDLVKEASAMLAASEISVYPIDVRGVTHLGADPSIGGRGNFDDRRGHDMTYGDILNEQENALTDTHSTMTSVAAQTGGKAFFNNNDLKTAIKDSISLGSSYYTLFYTPNNSDWNSQFRKIDVKTNRKGVKLLFRKGYYAVPDRQYSDQELRRMMATSLQRDVAESRMLKINVNVTKAKNSTNGIVLEYALDTKEYEYVDIDPTMRGAKVDLFVQAWDAEDKPAGSFLQSVNLPPPMDSSNTMRVRQTLGLTPAVRLLRVGVIDKTTGKIGTVDVTVPPMAATPTASAVPPVTGTPKP